jgi:hypothetical protein
MLIVLGSVTMENLCTARDFLATDPEVRVRFPALPNFLSEK